MFYSIYYVHCLSDLYSVCDWCVAALLVSSSKDDIFAKSYILTMFGIHVNASVVRLWVLSLSLVVITRINGADAALCVGDDPQFTASDSNYDVYYSVQPKQEYAKVFNLEYDRTSKTIAIQTSREAITYGGSEQDGETTTKKYFFRQCGSTLEPPPDHVKNFVIDLPVRCAVITATPQIGYLMVSSRLYEPVGDPAVL